ncbi:MAG: hypothetical protein ACXADB_02855 [Candidatus Hermodarchaeia archaeon]
MDDNKVEKLRKVGYKLQASCQLCANGMFSSKSSWGECKKFDYKHQKHSKSKRQLSIHASGVCDSFTKHDDVFRLFHYEEFGGWIRD